MIACTGAFGAQFSVQALAQVPVALFKLYQILSVVCVYIRINL